MLWVMLVLTVVDRHPALRQGVAAGRRGAGRHGAPGGAAVPAAVPPLGAPGALQRPPSSPPALARPARSAIDAAVQDRGLRPHRPARLPGGVAGRAEPARAGDVVRRVDARRRVRRRHARPADDDRAPPAPGRSHRCGAPPCGGRSRARSTTTPATGWRASACPGCPPRRSTAAFSYEGFEHVDDALGRRPRRRSSPCPTSAAGSGRVAGSPTRGSPITVVVEPLEPPELFEWFVSFRESLGMTVVPVGPDARQRPSCGRCGPTRSSASSPTATSRAAASRSSSSASARRCRAGRRRSACGPARRSCRPRCTSPSDRDGHHAVIRPPVPAERQGSLRDDVSASRSSWRPSSRRSSAPRPSSGTSSSPTGRAIRATNGEGL